ncbi:hypothetical protein EPO05_04395 [Patescibacteria group bacterium]|nr:MAG: hypothetical protein EPO05_04395 [Patescibacteria group bacterium]
MKRMTETKHIKKLSWEDIERLVIELGQQIKASSFWPDYLVGITVGGLVPLALLAKELGLNKIVTVSASSYEKDRQGELSILYLPEIDLKGQKVLLVDEIADTGQTLEKVSQVMREKYNPAELRTAVMAINQDKCQNRPDYFATAETGWVVFPWERKDFPEYF